MRKIKLNKDYVLIVKKAKTAKKRRKSTKKRTRKSCRK